MDFDGSMHWIMLAVLVDELKNININNIIKNINIKNILVSSLFWN